MKTKIWKLFSAIFKKPPSHSTSKTHYWPFCIFLYLRDFQICLMLIPKFRGFWYLLYYLSNFVIRSFTKFPPFSTLGKKIWKIKIIHGWVSQFSCRVMVPLLKDFPFSDSATHPLYPKLKHIAVCLPGKLSQR